MSSTSYHERDDMPTTADNTPVKLDEDASVTNWRLDQFMALGWNLDWATFLAHTRQDLGASRALLAKGASHLQVVRILSGQDFFGEDTTYDWDAFYSRMADE